MVRRYLVTSTDGIKCVKDRTDIFPPEIPLKVSEEDKDGYDLADMWEKYWIPAVASRKQTPPTAAN